MATLKEINEILQKTNYYAILGLNQYDATNKKIRSAYLRLAVKFHPDKNEEHKDVATKAFQKIKTAYEQLTDPELNKYTQTSTNSTSATNTPKQAQPNKPKQKPAPAANRNQTKPGNPEPDTPPLQPEFYVDANELVKQLFLLIDYQYHLNNEPILATKLAKDLREYKDHLYLSFKGLDEEAKGKKLFCDLLNLIENPGNYNKGIKELYLKEIKRLQKIRRLLGYRFTNNLNESMLTELHKDKIELNNSLVTRLYDQNKSYYDRLLISYTPPYVSLFTAYIRIYDPNYNASETPLSFDELIKLVKEKHPLPEGVDKDKINVVREKLLTTLTNAQAQLQKGDLRYFKNEAEFEDLSNEITAVHPRRKLESNLQLEKSRAFWRKTILKYLPTIFIPNNTPYKTEISRINKEIDQVLAGGSLSSDLRKEIINACYGQADHSALQLTQRLLADCKAQGFYYKEEVFGIGNPNGWKGKESYKLQLASIPVEDDSNTAQASHSQTPRGTGADGHFKPNASPTAGTTHDQGKATQHK